MGHFSIRFIIPAHGKKPVLSVAEYLSDVVDDGVKHPLDCDLGPAAEREVVEAFGPAQIPEHRLDDAHSVTVDVSAGRCVNLFDHRLRVILVVPAIYDEEIPFL